MRINSQRLQSLFGEGEVYFKEKSFNQPFKKDLATLNVDIDSLRGFLLLGGVQEGTQNLINDIHGPAESPNRELLLTFKQTQSYWKGPTYFFGPKETFLIAINLAYHYRDTISYYDRLSARYAQKAEEIGLSVSPLSPEKAKLKAIKKYFQKSEELLHEDPELEETIKLYKGIKTFDEARECRSYDRDKSNNLLKQAKEHFCELLKRGKQHSTAITFLGIIEALLGRVESALNFLVKAADLVFNPKPIYTLMAKLFKVIRMRNASKFYKKKSVTGHTRLSLVS